MQVTEDGETTSWRSPPGHHSEAVAVVATSPHFPSVSYFALRRAYTVTGSQLTSAGIPESNPDRGRCDESERQTRLRERLDQGGTVELQGDHLSVTSDDIRFDLELAVTGSFWGTDNDLVQAVRNGIDTPIELSGPPADERPPWLETTSWSVAIIQLLTCDNFFQPAVLTGGTLTTAGEWVSSGDGCTEASEAAVGQDAWLRGLLDAEPTVTIDGDRITIEHGDVKTVFQTR